MHIACPLPDDVQQDLSGDFDITVAVNPTPTPGELREALLGRQVLFTSVNTALSADLIAALPESVRAIATYSVGYDHIDLGAARARGIAVFNTPDVLTPSVAEAAIFLMLGAARRATESISLVRSGTWSGWTPRQLNGFELWRKAIGILGMGRIGRAIAARARAFEMSVHYCNRSRLPPELEQGATFHPEPEQMLSAIDVLMLASPSTPETRGFLNETRLRRLRPGGIVVNIGRGDLVVDDALIAALTRRQIYAAGLDVFDHEPQIDRRYFDLPNVFMLPHIGSATVEARRRMGAALREGLAAWRNGARPENRLV
jgi:glyoxylate reductase